METLIGKNSPDSMKPEILTHFRRAIVTEQSKDAPNEVVLDNLTAMLRYSMANLPGQTCHVMYDWNEDTLWVENSYGTIITGVEPIDDIAATFGDYSVFNLSQMGFEVVGMVNLNTADFITVDEWFGSEETIAEIDARVYAR